MARRTTPRRAPNWAKSEKGARQYSQDVIDESRRVRRLRAKKEARMDALKPKPQVKFGKIQRVDPEEEQRRMRNARTVRQLKTV